MGSRRSYNVPSIFWETTTRSWNSWEFQPPRSAKRYGDGSIRGQDRDKYFLFFWGWLEGLQIALKNNLCWQTFDSHGRSMNYEQAHQPKYFPSHSCNLSSVAQHGTDFTSKMTFSNCACPFIPVSKPTHGVLLRCQRLCIILLQDLYILIPVSFKLNWRVQIYFKCCLQGKKIL